MREPRSVDRGIEVNGNLIGSINIIEFSERDEWCELGYCIGYQYWNKGYMTEAVNAVVDYLFSNVNFYRIVIRNATDNPASGKVAEKCGFIFEGTQRGLMKARADGFYDMEVRAILREDWLKFTRNT